MSKILSIIGSIFSFLYGLTVSFFRVKKNQEIVKQNNETISNEIKKIAKNAESTDDKIKQKAIDDMRRLISD